MHIESIRQRAEFLALETLVIGMTRAMQRSFPSFGPSLRQTGNHMLSRLDQVVVKGQSPEVSDLLAAELRDAWEQLLAKVLSTEADGGS